MFSALAPKADSRRTSPEVRFVPQAAILVAVRRFRSNPDSDLHSVSHRGVIAGQDFDDHVSTATIPRRSTPLEFEAALSRAATEACARACARSGSAASEAVTSWAGSARKPSRARVLSLPGSP